MMIHVFREVRRIIGFHKIRSFIRLGMKDLTKRTLSLLPVLTVAKAITKTVI